MRARWFLPAFSIAACLAQTPSAPRFDVVSIKPCKTAAAPSLSPDAPGKLTLNCQTVKGLIQMAYLFFADGQVHPAVTTPIFGGPAWIDTEMYSIAATSATPQNTMTMRGPMMQAVLEDRFHLKVHRETRDIPVYALTIAKGDPSSKPSKKEPALPSTPPRFHRPRRVRARPIASRAIPSPGQICWSKSRPPRSTTSASSSSAASTAPVVNRTGIPGRFNIRLQYADRATLPNDTTAAPRVFQAIEEQLGLQLEPAKGPSPFLVIDTVSRPTEN